MLRYSLLLAFCAGMAPAQSLRIYSEFQRIDPFGEVAAPDRGDEPREILSPAVIRNAWNSFHLACTVADEAPSFLYIQQNPEMFPVDVYREIFVKTPAGWLPDALEKVTLPYTITLPDIENPIPNQTTEVFWLDIRVPAKTPPGRMRFQAVLRTGERWIVYPLEIRVQEAAASAGPAVNGPLPPVTARADAALLGALRRRLCGTRGPGQAAPALTVRAMIRRNALQDFSLKPHRLAAALDEAGYPLRTFCGGAPPRDLPAEWWLKVRARLWRRQ